MTECPPETVYRAARRELDVAVALARMPRSAPRFVARRLDEALTDHAVAAVRLLAAIDTNPRARPRAHPNQEEDQCRTACTSP